MLRRSSLRSRIWIAVLVLVAALAGTAAAVSATPKSPGVPSAKEFVPYLDLECFRTSPYTPPPLHEPLRLSHLNPVLADQAPWTIDSLGLRTQLCSPVAKNDQFPPDNVIDFVRYVDLSCYRIGGPALNLTLKLNHLNPLLAHLPTKVVTVLSPQQLCLPVIKNESVPPDEVLRLVQYIDLVCYGETPPVSLDQTLRLTQLNKELTSIPPTKVGVRQNRQLCVPVRKNDQVIPDDVLKVVQYIDLEKYDLAAPDMHPLELRLRHINPLLTGLPAEPAVLTAHHQLALPVMKNGNFPTG